MDSEWKPTKSQGYLILTVYWYLKTFIIMANIDLKFIDYYAKHETISVKKGFDKIIEINIFDGNFHKANICLDIPTAIKFAKTLRTEINKAKEVSND